MSIKSATEGGGWQRKSVQWVGFALLEGFAAANMFILAFAAPKFQRIFHDMLGNRPLPVLTSLVLNGSVVFEALAPVYMVAGIWIISNNPRKAGRLLFVLLPIAAVQSAFITCALFLPLISDIQGIEAGR